MNSNSISVIRPLQTTQFWLLAIAGGLIAIDLSLSWKSEPDFSKLSMSIICWSVVLSLLWDKRRTLILESDAFSSCLGLLLIAFFLLRSSLMTSFDSVFQMLPVLAALGLAMLASGVKRVPQYWQEIIVIFALNLPVGFLVNRISILAVYTAKLATLLLTYSGFIVKLQGVYITLANGKTVEVAAGCSGWESIFPLLQFSVLFLVMFPTNLTKKILVPIVAVLIAFVVNGVRVAIMAALVAYSSEGTFKYWHTGTGSQIFFLISTVLFAGFCYLVSQKDRNNQETREFSGS
jgi:cyanoexosortase A